MRAHRYERDPEARFWEQVDKTESCWLWTGTLTTDRYGCISVEGVTRLAHRIAYQWLVGAIPEGLELDHLCRVRHCVNPAHLESVEHRENMLRGATIVAENARKTHCLRGHEFTPENTYTRLDRPRSRDCLTCRRERSLAHRRRKEG